MNDEITRVFDRLGGIEATQKAMHESIGGLRADVQKIETKMVGTNSQPGLCTRVTLLEEWKVRMVRSVRRTWAGIVVIVTGVATRLLWGWWD